MPQTTDLSLAERELLFLERAVEIRDNSCGEPDCDHCAGLERMELQDVRDELGLPEIAPSEPVVCRPSIEQEGLRTTERRRRPRESRSNVEFVDSEISQDRLTVLTPLEFRIVKGDFDNPTLTCTDHFGG